jgi:hypothetical protein
MADAEKRTVGHMLEAGHQAAEFVRQQFPDRLVGVCLRPENAFGRTVMVTLYPDSVSKRRMHDIAENTCPLADCDSNQAGRCMRCDYTSQHLAALQPDPPPVPAPEPPTQKRYCWECRWESTVLGYVAQPLCTCPNLRLMEHIGVTCAGVVGCPANATGDCQHWEAKDGTD